MNDTSVQVIVEKLQKLLELECKAGEGGDQRVIKQETVKGDRPLALIGHLNFIHPNKIQVLGKSELTYLEKLGKNSRSDCAKQIFMEERTVMVVITGGQAAPHDFLILADRNHIPLYTALKNSQEVINHFQYHLGRALADSTVIHGVFMEVMGSGVLLTGSSGVGKSELALELISRGHRLVADDAPEFSRIAPDIVNGNCPELLREFLEVRGLGILNICSIFGDSAVKPSKYLRLIIALKEMNEEQLHAVDRLRGSKHYRNVLNVNIPEITLPVAPGRNLAIAVETAVRNHMLLQKGYDAAEDFIQRQSELLRKSIQ
ncbi:MAG: HPr(Ser) kinase/phosphatase [Gammaproteobacteria bacterium]|nr:HPr(Ser) kinase/phosphatase [Gammaproteobacteria bacterium]